MLRTLPQIRGKTRYVYLFGSILIIGISLLCAGLPSKVASAHAFSRALGVEMVSGETDFRLTSNSCQASPAGKPGSDSLLVVLLDRSGSLIDEPGATDPNHYSTSVTKVLADLWPGKMAVIPFKGDTIPLQQIGPFAMSDPTQRDTLKNQIPEADPNGNTPLGPAMDQALQLMKGAAPGSRVMVITDGEPNTTSDPDGSLEEAHIRHDLLKQFCVRGLPISPFGLEINDPRADALLSDIAVGTGGTYTKVQSPEQLAQNVIQLYRDWQDLALSRPARDVGGSYSVFVNDFASHAYIVTFRSDSSFAVQLFGSDGKTPVTGLQPVSIDKHYVIYKLDMSSFSSGSYQVKVVSDKGVLDSAAQVYALADYPLLHVNLIAPDVQYAYITQPLTIKAALFNGEKQYVPTSVVTMTVDITYHEEGQPDKTVTRTLDQQGQRIFSHQFPAYPQLGQLRIVVHATYQGIRKDSQVYTVQLVKPPYVCTKGLFPCIWEQYHTPIWIALAVLSLLVLLLIAWLLWRRQPEPFGYLHSKKEQNADALALATLRPFPKNLLRKSIINSAEIRDANPRAFPVGSASFSLVFRPGDKAKAGDKDAAKDKAYIRAETSDISVELPNQNSPAPVKPRIGKARLTAKQEQEEEQWADTKVPAGTAKELPSKATIKIKGVPLASFEAVGKAKTKK